MAVCTSESSSSARKKRAWRKIEEAKHRICAFVHDAILQRLQRRVHARGVRSTGIPRAAAELRWNTGPLGRSICTNFPHLRCSGLQEGQQLLPEALHILRLRLQPQHGCVLQRRGHPVRGQLVEIRKRPGHFQRFHEPFGPEGQQRFCLRIDAVKLIREVEIASPGASGKLPTPVR